MGVQTTLGAVNLIKSEEEFDLVLKGHSQQLIVLEASLTWCRPCKGFDRAYQACTSFSWSLCTPPARSLLLILAG